MRKQPRALLCSYGCLILVKLLMPALLLFLSFRISVLLLTRACFFITVGGAAKSLDFLVKSLIPLLLSEWQQYAVTASMGSSDRLHSIVMMANQMSKYMQNNQKMGDKNICYCRTKYLFQLFLTCINFHPKNHHRRGQEEILYY